MPPARKTKTAPAPATFRLKTTVGFFRKIADAIQCILRDVNIIYDDEGLYIQGMDPAHVSCFESRLTPHLFDDQRAPYSGHLGINIQNLIIILASAAAPDILVLETTSAEADTLDITIEHGADTTSYQCLRLMDLNGDLMEIPPPSAPVILDFDRKFFQDTIAKFFRLGVEEMNVIRDPASGQFELTATSNISTIRVVLLKSLAERTPDTGLTDMERSLAPLNITKEEGDINIRLSIRQLDMFCKGVGFSKRVSTYISPDSPFVLNVDIASPTGPESSSAGYMRQYLAPKAGE